MDYSRMSQEGLSDEARFLLACMPYKNGQKDTRSKFGELLHKVRRKLNHLGYQDADTVTIDFFSAKLAAIPGDERGDVIETAHLLASKRKNLEVIARCALEHYAEIVDQRPIFEQELSTVPKPVIPSYHGPPGLQAVRLSTIPKEIRLKFESAPIGEFPGYRTDPYEKQLDLRE